MRRRRDQFNWAGRPAATKRLEALFAYHTFQEIADILSREFRWSFTASAIKSRSRILGLVSVGRLPYKWTPEADARLLELARQHTYKVCAKILNDEGFDTSIKGVRGRARMLGIRRYENVGRFRSGHTANLGVKRPGFRNAGTFCPRGPVSRDDYRRGTLPVNVDPLGTINIREGRKGKAARVYIKVDAPNPHAPAWGAWVSLARYTWEQAHGAIRPGHAIIHLDGDPLNCGLDNLMMLARGELGVLNRIFGAEMDQAQASKSRELQVAVVNLARVYRAAHRRKKGTVTI